MRSHARHGGRMGDGWLVFFYSVPTRPVASRVKVWRKLQKSGAVKLKGAVYILPMSAEHRELFVWLTSEVASMKGEAGFLVTEKIEPMAGAEIKALFNQARDADCRALEKGISALENILSSVRKGSRIPDRKKLSDRLLRLMRSFAETRRVDFFSSPSVAAAAQRLSTLEKDLASLMSGGAPSHDKDTAPPRIPLLEARLFRGRLWSTRTRPFVDRMASAWLIRDFIDQEAGFAFIGDESAPPESAQGVVTFDIEGGDFTHTGDLCTFEVLMRSFGLRDKAVMKIAELVHELDVHDGKYQCLDAPGVLELLGGIRRTARSDQEALEKGIDLFRLLYASKNQGAA